MERASPRKNVYDSTYLFYQVAHIPNYLLMNQKCLLAVRALLRKLRLLDITKDNFDRVVDVYAGARLSVLVLRLMALLKSSPILKTPELIYQ